MARYFKKFFLFPFPLTLALLLLSCQEGHEAGDLLGMWKREAVAADNQYVAFSGNIVLMRAV